MASETARTREAKPAPWRRKNPKPKAARAHLTDAQKAQARARAAKAGRPYPNLIDNMAVAAKAKRGRER